MSSNNFFKKVFNVILSLSLFAYLAAPVLANAGVPITITTPASGSTITTGSTTINGTTSPNYTVNLSIDGGAPVAVLANGSGNWTYTTPSLANGNHTFEAKVTGGPFGYILGNSSDNASVVDTTSIPVSVETNIVTPLLSQPFGIATHPTQNRAYITNFDNGNVSVVNTATDQVVGTISTGGTSLTGITLNPSGTIGYVANFGPLGDLANDSVIVVNTVTELPVGSPITVGNGPAGIALNPAANRAYVTNFNAGGSGTISVIDTDPLSPTYNTVVGTIGAVDGYTNNGPAGIAINPAGTRAYVTNFYDGIGGSVGNTVSVIDTDSSSPNYNTVIGTVIGVGNGPVGIAINSAGTRAYVTNYANSFWGGAGNTVSVIDTVPGPTYNTVIDTITVGNGPVGIALNSAGTRAYVSNSVDDSVSIIDITTVPGTELARVAVTADNAFAFGNFLTPSSITNNAILNFITSVNSGGNPGGNSGGTGNTSGNSAFGFGQQSEGTDSQSAQVLAENTSKADSDSNKSSDKDKNGEVKSAQTSNLFNSLNWLWWSLIGLAALVLIIWLIARRQKRHQ
ncbi:MAG: YncE family protein [bacterium]|nr:YncE family protein [bacterium]